MNMGKELFILSSSVKRIKKEQIAMCFEAKDNDNFFTVFD